MSTQTDQLAAELQRLRTVRGETLRQVEDATGISNAYLSQLERGTAKNPTANVLYKLSDHYGVSYEVLMRWAGYTSGTTGGSRSALTAAQIALKSAVLTPEEDAEVAKYVEFLVSRKRKRSK